MKVFLAMINSSYCEIFEQSIMKFRSSWTILKYSDDCCVSQSDLIVTDESMYELINENTCAPIVVLTENPLATYPNAVLCIFRYQKISNIIESIEKYTQQNLSEQELQVSTEKCPDPVDSVSDSYYAVCREVKRITGENITYETGQNDEQILHKINEISQEYFAEHNPKCKIDDVVKFVFDAMRGLDVIQQLIDDDEITEVMVNGYNNIYIEKEGRVTKTNLRFADEKDLENLIQRIVSSVDRSVNQAHPIVDARLENGARVNVVLPPLSLDGPILTIRKFPDTPLTMNDLIRFKSISPDAAVFLESLVKSHHNIFISGGTGSGKTTFLNILSDYIPADERVITIEDSAELKLNNIKNLVRLEKRNANTQDVGEIDIRQLIKTSLRMRPDRIIVGEVRGDEAIDMLQAMNTGHDGSLSTGHANSATDMLIRLETMVLTGAEIPIDAIRNQISSAIDYVIHLSRFRDKTRRATEISEVVGYKDGKPMLNTIFRFIETGVNNGKIQGELVPTGNKIQNCHKFRQYGMEVPVWQ